MTTRTPKSNSLNEIEDNTNITETDYHVHQYTQIKVTLDPT